jgi:beta-1,4-mannosyl-glycoprotein beta-1,4-N-acetylglucosaminyltransferase
MIVDAFTFFNELDMLEFRLRMLWPVVDFFLIVESDVTFSGEAKPYYFLGNLPRFAWAKDKILYHKVSINPSIYDKSAPKPTKYTPEHSCWNIEAAQRNAIVDGCYALPSDATVLMGDLDEIPTREALVYLLDTMPHAQAPVVFQQAMFYYNLKFLRKELWHGTIASTLETLRISGAQKLRDRRNGIPYAIKNGGWHLSYFNNVEGIRNKIESLSHRELDLPEYKDEAHIAYCMETGEDLFDRDVPIKRVHPQEFPEYFREYANKEWW